MNAFSQINPENASASFNAAVAKTAWFDRYRPGAVRVVAPTVKCGACEGSGKAWSVRHANDPIDGPDCEACGGVGEWAA